MRLRVLYDSNLLVLMELLRNVIGLTTRWPSFTVHI
jgi:hypothetical protein